MRETKIVTIYEDLYGGRHETKEEAEREDQVIRLTRKLGDVIDKDYLNAYDVAWAVVENWPLIKEAVKDV